MFIYSEKNNNFTRQSNDETLQKNQRERAYWTKQQLNENEQKMLMFKKCEYRPFG